MKRISGNGLKSMLGAVCILVFFFLFTSSFPVIAQNTDLEMEIQSGAALLMEYNTGEVIFAYNEHKKLYPASLTKIMTLLLALEALSRGEISLEDEVPVTEKASSMGGSQLFLSPGDVVDMESLLIGIAVGSANDAAVAVAEYLAGSEEAFVERMNRRAGELSMKNTNFENSTGLHSENHYSTAYDIAILSREILTYPLFYRWSNTWMDENFLEGKIKAGKVYLSNTNRLIHNYQGCDGIKTGYTREAGYNIAATAKRNDTRFLAVVLNAPSSDIRYQEAVKLLNSGFANYYSVLLARASEKITTLPVEKGTLQTVDVVTSENLSLLVRKGEEASYTTKVVLPQRLTAPLADREKVGKMQAWTGNKILKEVDLEVVQEVERASFPLLLRRYLETWLRFGR